MTSSMLNTSKNRFHVFLLLLVITGLLSNSIQGQSLVEKQNQGWNSMEQILSRIQAPSFPDKTFMVKDHGLIGDGKSDNCSAMRKLLDEVSTNGGGTILFPSGKFFFDGPIHLKSNIHLKLNDGALIYFGQNAEKYLPSVKVRWEGTVCYNYSPLIYGYQLKNVAITGEGSIDGAALRWSKEWRKNQNPDKKILRQMGNDLVPEQQRVFGNGFLDLDKDGKDDGFGDGKQHLLRPSLLELYECENILLQGVEFKNSPFWTIHPVFSKNITIDGITVYGESLNDDGVDPDSSEDVLIQNCTIQTHDDAISIKAGRDQDAWNRPGSKNMIIRNNRLLSGVNAFCIGSEMSGGVENLFIYNNTIKDGKHALNFKCNLDRGGEVKNIYIRDLDIESCDEAMFIFRMDYHGYRGNNYPTKFQNFFVSEIKCQSVEGTAFKIVGVRDEPIKNILLKNIEINSAGKATEVKHAQNIVFYQVNVNGILLK
jgi:polygalacturonase